MLGIDAFAELNYWAVLVAAVATFFLGAFWYSPILFAKAWMKAHGYSDEKLKEMMRAGAGKIYGVSFVSYVVMATMFSLFFFYTGAAGVRHGLLAGAGMWLGFVAPTSLTANMFSDKPLSAWLIDGGYQLCYLLLMGVILASWR